MSEQKHVVFATSSKLHGKEYASKATARRAVQRDAADKGTATVGTYWVVPLDRVVRHG
jgi:hypothetical protein